MSKAAFDKIAAGLKAAIAHANGDETAGVLHKFEAPDLDVSAVREKTKLSQERFAATFGVSLGTLRGWEQRRRRPDGPARVLLTLIDRDPVSVLKALAGTKAKRPKRAAHADRPRAAVTRR